MILNRESYACRFSQLVTIPENADLNPNKRKYLFFQTIRN